MKIKRNSRSSVYINVAPLVEVMLVLVIIFMITAPTLNIGVQVNLPKTQAASLNNSETTPVVISIDKHGQLYIEEKKLSINELMQKLPHILQNSKTDIIYIRGDKDLSYGRIMEIMGIISSSGSCKVSLISDPVSEANILPIDNKVNHR